MIYYEKGSIQNEAIRFEKLAANDNRLAKDIAQWKESVAERWDSIHVVSKGIYVPQHWFRNRSYIQKLDT